MVAELPFVTTEVFSTGEQAFMVAEGQFVIMLLVSWLLLRQYRNHSPLISNSYTANPLTSFCLLYFFFVVQVQLIHADQTCHEPEICAGQTLNDSGHTTIGGYKGAFGVNTYTAFSGGRLDCSGSYSCWFMAFIKAQTSVYCRGFRSCSDTVIQSISSFIYCYGTISCSASNITTKDLICVGHMSCASSYIFGIETLYAGGTLALHNSTIDTYSSASQTITILLQGYSAGYGASLLCRAGHTCNIHCEAFTSCTMFYINCIGDCVVSLSSSHFNAPITNLTVFNNNLILDLGIHKLFDREVMVPYIDESCIMAELAFDTAGERYKGPDIVVTVDNDGPICCRAEWACHSVHTIEYQTQTKHKVPFQTCILAHAFVECTNICIVYEEKFVSD